MFDIRTLKFKAIVLVWSFSTPLVREPNEFVISSSEEFENVDLASDDVTSTLSLLILHSTQ